MDVGCERGGGVPACVSRRWRAGRVLPFRARSRACRPGVSDRAGDWEEGDGKYFEIAGVSEELRDIFSGRSREVARAADRFRARYGRAPELGELRDLALENRCAKKLTNRADLENVWRDTASRYGFGPDEALRLLAGGRTGPAVRPVEERIEECLTERHAVFELRDLHTVALEQTAGELSPNEALYVARQMIQDRRVLTLEGGRMTTLAVRAQEQAIERRAAVLARPAGRDVGHTARMNAAREVAERIGRRSLTSKTWRCSS